MRNIIILITTVLLAATVSLSSAHQPVRWYEPVSIEVIGEDGGTLLPIPHRDFQDNGTHIIKKFLEARKGQNYGIVVRNMTPDRIGVVIAVDGRNIISGKQSSLRNSEEMYVIDGHGYARLDGWRTDSSTVHKFYFTEVADSYSARTFNDTSAMGVIAVAVYREKKRPRPVYKAPRSAGNVPAAAEERASKSMSKSRDESAGTGFGESMYAPVVQVSFEPAAAPVQKTLFKYEWSDVLCKKGLLACSSERGNRLWDEGSYAPFPPGYRNR
jgi:hypothetical protein